MEKKVPANKNCGIVIILANGGIELSFFAIPDTTKPKPIKTINPSEHKISMLIKVTKP